MTAVCGGRLPQQIVNIIQAVGDYANDAPVQHSFTGSGASSSLANPKSAEFSAQSRGYVASRNISKV